MDKQASASKQEVDGLIEQIRQTARLQRALPTVGRSGAADATSETSSGPLDAYLAELARRSHPWTELPLRFRRFPLTLAPMRSLALRVYNLLTKEQRATNVLLRDALQALQAAQARGELASREIAVLADYVRALLMNARAAGASGSAAAPSLRSGAAAASASGMDSFFVALGDEFRGRARADQGTTAHLLANGSRCSAAGPRARSRLRARRVARAHAGSGNRSHRRGAESGAGG